MLLVHLTGSNRAVLEVPVLHNSAQVEPVTFSVMLHTPVHATLGDPSTATVTLMHARTTADDAVMPLSQDPAQPHILPAPPLVSFLLLLATVFINP